MSVLTDTDSLLISSNKNRSKFEAAEVRALLQQDRQIPWHESLVGHTLASDFVRVYGRILDWSSINNEVQIFLYFLFVFVLFCLTLFCFCFCFICFICFICFCCFCFYRFIVVLLFFYFFNIFIYFVIIGLLCLSRPI